MINNTNKSRLKTIRIKIQPSLLPIENNFTLMMNPFCDWMWETVNPLCILSGATDWCSKCIYGMFMPHMCAGYWISIPKYFSLMGAFYGCLSSVHLMGMADKVNEISQSLWNVIMFQNLPKKNDTEPICVLCKFKSVIHVY